MRFFSFRVRALLGLLLAAGCASLATAQITPGDPGWYLRVIDVNGTIDNYERHNNVLAQGDLNQPIDDSVHEVINFNGAGRFGDTNDWPVPLGEDFVVRGQADATIPAGEWAVGWGSDDGGQISIPGVEFVTRFNTAGDFQPDDQLVFDGNRGYNTTWGSFSLEAPLETKIDVSMWERGGGDNFNVFYINLDEQYGITADELTDAATDTPSLDNLWGLLGVGDQSDAELQGDWDIRVPAGAPSPVTLPVSPGQLISGQAQDVVKEEIGEVLPGLLHYWYGRNNPGSLEGVSAFYEFGVGPVEEPDIAAFNPDNTWWTGNQAALEGGTTEAPKYPAEIIDQPRLDGGTFNGNDNSNYTTALAGQLRVPRDGEYLFSDGVDDLTVLAVDANRDGEFDPDTEILINDNAWTNLNRDANNGGFPNEYVPVTFDVPEDGNCDDPEAAADECWFAIEAVFGEGGGTDAGIIYWNENSDVEFPTENGEGRVIAAEDISELAIPEDHLRAPGGIRVVSANLAATLNNSYPYEFNVSEDGTFDSLTVNRTLEVATTSLDLNDATINLVTDGDVSALGELQILSADSISGEVSVNVPEGVIVDVSKLATEGIICFPTCGDVPEFLPADFDMSGSVDFPDFLFLSGEFGNAVDPAGSPPDLNGNGTVDFPDFLQLSATFGQSAAAAASVPEPSGLALLCISLGWIGMMRRRR